MIIFVTNLRQPILDIVCSIWKILLTQTHTSMFSSNKQGPHRIPINREQKRPWPRRLRRQISRQQSLMEGSRHPSYTSHRRSSAVGNSCFADCTMNIFWPSVTLPFSICLFHTYWSICAPLGNQVKNVRQGSPLIKHYHSIHQNITAQGHVWILLRHTC